MAHNMGKHFEEVIRRLRATGRYQNDSEVIRAGLRLLEDKEFAPAALELELVKSLDSPVRPLEKNWATKIKREARALAKQRRRSDRHAARQQTRSRIGENEFGIGMHKLLQSHRDYR